MRNHHLSQFFSFWTAMLSMCVCVCVIVWWFELGWCWLCVCVRGVETKNKRCTKSFHARDENRRKWRNQRNSRGDDEHIIIICNVQVAKCLYTFKRAWKFKAFECASKVDRWFIAGTVGWIFLHLLATRNGQRAIKFRPYTSICHPDDTIR